MKKIILILTLLFVFNINVEAKDSCTYKFIYNQDEYKLVIDRNNGEFSIFNSANKQCSGEPDEGCYLPSFNFQWLDPYDNINGGSTKYYYIQDSCADICYNPNDPNEISFSIMPSQAGTKKSCNQDNQTLKAELNSVEIDPSTKYDGVKVCQGYGEYIQECGCIPAALTDITSRLYFLLKIVAPALLLIIGGFELIKAMGAQDEKAIKKAQEKLVKKLIAAAAVFLIFTIIQFVISVLSSDSADTFTCVKYFIDGYVF